MKNKFKMAICQIKVLQDELHNIENAFKFIESAVSAGANVVLLPEIFVCPYDVKMFAGAAVNDSSDLIKKLKTVSEKHSILLIAGTVPEKDESGNLYNTSYVFENGKQLCKHRKMHLFDINIEGKINFQESKIFSAGDELTVCKTSFGDIGVAICFDLRFPEMFKIMAQKGARIIFVPAAFNTVTGPLHWDVMLRARALDCQCFLVACSPALNKDLKYHAWGHSALVDPMGQVVASADSEETMLLEDVDLEIVEKSRKDLPILSQTRLI